MMTLNVAARLVTWPQYLAVGLCLPRLIDSLSARLCTSRSWPGTVGRCLESEAGQRLGPRLLRRLPAVAGFLRSPRRLPAAEERAIANTNPGASTAYRAALGTTCAKSSSVGRNRHRRRGAQTHDPGRQADCRLSS